MEIIARLKGLHSDWQIFHIRDGIRCLSRDGIVMRYDVVAEKAGHASSVAGAGVTVAARPISGSTPTERLTTEDIVADFWGRYEAIVRKQNSDHHALATDNSGAVA